MNDEHGKISKRLAAAKTNAEILSAVSDATKYALKETVRLQSLHIKVTAPLVGVDPALRGQRKGKVDRLTTAIDEALATLGQQATAEAVLRHIEQTGSVVAQVEDGVIVWKDARGREKRTGRRSFDNKVSSRRN